MPITQYARDAELNWLLNASAVTRPTAWYVSLHTGFPGDLGTTISNELTSGTATSYARVATGTMALTNHVMQNSSSITLGPAGGTWPTVTWIGVCDALTLGNLLAYAELSQYGSSYFLASVQLANPGSGHAVNDVLTITSGGGATLTVDAVATVNGVAGVITQCRISNHGSLASIPATTPMATTSSGAGTGTTILPIWLLGPTGIQLNNGDSMVLGAGQLQIEMG
jgi:hypothetical protein